MRAAKPTRRVLQVDSRYKRIVDSLSDEAQLIDLARTMLDDTEIGIGWPERVSRDPDAPLPAACEHGDTDCTCRVVDYADPTGEQSARYAQLKRRRDALLHAEREIERLGNHALKTARLVVAEAGLPVDTEPLCEGCGERSVEPHNSQDRRKFRGVESVNGARGWWLRKDNRTPALCGSCRQKAVI